jgi:hypothetical protein
LVEAYHHWIAVDYEQKTSLYEYLEAFESDIIPLPPGEPPDADIPQEPLAPPPSRWLEEALENVCPCCFNFRELPRNFCVGISVDGNMQHKRFRDRSPWEFEVFRSILFVHILVRSFSLAADTQKKIAEADKAVTE